jgi:prefoldin subunit 5
MSTIKKLKKKNKALKLKLEKLNNRILKSDKRHRKIEKKFRAAIKIAAKLNHKNEKSKKK